MTVPVAGRPFEDSRRLTGCNLFFDEPGAVLEAGAAAATPDAIDAWRAHITRARQALGWPDGPIAARQHAHGTTLALAAPLDQLFTATEVNEWAVWASLGTGTPPCAPGDPAAWDESEALATLAALARAERNPALIALTDAAAKHGVGALIDDEEVTLGGGHGARSWPRKALPDPGAIDWSAIADVPVALITGSNGKTTTTRLLAALARAHGWHTAHTCTDGVVVDGHVIEAGDYSGPAGARLALRQPGIDVAILETARGGILRRGIAPQRAKVAVVTNISDDHFGEYGVDNLADLANVKLTVARPLGTGGTLVLNADDAQLAAHIPGVRAHLALFAQDADTGALQALRAQGGATCGVRGGHLILAYGHRAEDLGPIDGMPLTFGGAARYNVANVAAAALAATALGISADTLRTVLASFGNAHADNPGRLEHFTLGGIEVIVDYAHNPDGMRSLLAVATRVHRGRLALLLGQAGNRGDDKVRALADVVADAHPDCIVLKDLPGYLRGRAAGEVPAILRAELLQRGVDAAHIAIELDEWRAARALLAWARAGDTLVLPIHGKRNRPRVGALLEGLARTGWRAGSTLPADAPNPADPS